MIEWQWNILKRKLALFDNESAFPRLMKRTRILLADDHPLTLTGIRVLLEPHYEIVGTMTDGRALVDAALRLHPKVIVMDIACHC